MAADDHSASVRSAARVLKLLEWLATQTEQVSLADASAALDLPKSSVRLLLTTLVEEGYVTREGDGGYLLRRLPGERQDGAVWPSLVRNASPVIWELVGTLRESGFIGVLVGSRVRYLTKILPDREVVYNRNITVERIPHQTASGLAILSALSVEEIEHYLSTSDDPELRKGKAAVNLLRATLVSARNRGVASNMRGVFDGAAGAAAPVLNKAGRPIGAINISGPLERVKENLPAIERAVAEAAQRVTDSMVRMGHGDARAEPPPVEDPASLSATQLAAIPTYPRST